MKPLIVIIILQAAAMLCIEAFAGHGKAWYEPQGKELRLVCYSTVTGPKCANMWVEK